MLRTNIKSVIYREKTTKLLITLLNSKTDKCKTDLMKAVDFTWSYVSKLFETIGKEGLVTETKKGRKMIIKLTEKGIEIAKHLEGIEKTLNGKEVKG